MKAVAGWSFAAGVYSFVRLFGAAAGTAEKHPCETAAVWLIVDTRFLFFWLPLLRPTDVVHRPFTVVGVPRLTFVLRPPLLV